MTAQPSPAPRSFEVTIRIKTVSELNAREHHMARHRRRQKEKRAVGLVVSAHIRRHGIKVPCSVTLTRCAPSSGLDQDNLVSSMKSAIDAIAAALEVDDRDERITWDYRQRRGKPREYAVDVKVVANG
jgi:hypothetical protein